MIIALFLPHGGCPERCTFCDQRVSGGEAVAPAKVREVIEKHLAARDHADEIAFYGGTFTALMQETQLRYLEAVRPWLQSGAIGGVRISTRPDALDPAWLARLTGDFKLKTVELGLQSTNPEVLRELGRSHSVQDAETGVELLKRLGIRAGIHLMIGCPAEGANDDTRTVEWLKRVKPDFVRIHPLLVLKGTPLEEKFRSGKFQPLELEAAVACAAAIVERVERSGIEVIRMGLQANEILDGDEQAADKIIVAGPWHPAFGDLVRARIMRGRVARSIERLGATADQAVEIEAAEEIVSQIRGHNSQNLAWLSRRFNLCSLRVGVLRVGAALRHSDDKTSRDRNPFTVRMYHPDWPA